MSPDVSALLAVARKSLKESAITSYNIDSLMLLGYASSNSKEDLMLSNSLIICEDDKVRFYDFVEKRKHGMPVAKIIGQKNFYYDSFFVSEDVLDPRPDSEALIEAVLKQYPDKSFNLNLLEIGVGSGCLVITLLQQYQNMQAIGLDISTQAIEICRKNAMNLAVNGRLNLIESNIFSKLVISKKFDLIISNPPYIPTADIKKLAPDLKYDPIIALDGGIDGLDYYRQIAQESSNFLRNNGHIIVEIGYGQKDDVVEIFAQYNFYCHEIKKDLAGVDRVLNFVLS